MKNRVLSNAIWNAVNGSSSAIVAVIVPPFLTRQLTPEAYGAWALALQIGTYVNLFGFGIQMAVGRYVAYYETRDAIADRDGIVATAFWFLSAMTIAAMIGIVAIAIALPVIVPDLPAGLMTQARTAIVLVGLSLSLNLPTAVFAAVFTGRQEAHVPATIQGGSRLLLALSLIIASLSHNLGVLGLVYLIVAGGSTIALWTAWRRHTHAPTVARHHASRRHGRELVGFCFSLTIWNLAMLLIGGLDLLIVGHFDYTRTPYFSICVTLATLVVGTLSSLANALIPAAAGLQATNDVAGLRVLMMRSSRMIVAAALLVALPLALEGEAVLRLWVGREYATIAAGMLSYLIVAAAIRNLVVPYVTTAIGLGYQRRMTLTPIIEASLSFALSVWFAREQGATGVAMAKVISGTVGVLLVLIQHPLREALGDMSRRMLVVNGILRPMAPVPVVLFVAACLHVTGLHESFAGLVAISLCTVLSVWFLALHDEDRVQAISILTRRHRVRMPAGGTRP